MSRITKRSNNSDIIRDFYIQGPINTEIMNDTNNIIQQSNVNIGILRRMYDKNVNDTKKIQDITEKNKQIILEFKKQEENTTYSRNELLEQIMEMNKFTRQNVLYNTLPIENIVKVEKYIKEINTVFLPYFQRSIERLKTNPKPNKNQEFIKNLQTYQQQKILSPVAKSIGNFCKKILTIATGPIYTMGQNYVIKGVITNIFEPYILEMSGIDHKYYPIAKTVVGLGITFVIGMQKEYEKRKNDPNTLNSELNFINRIGSGVCYMVINSAYILPEGYMPNIGINTYAQGLIGDGMIYSYSSNLARAVFPVAVNSIFTIFQSSKEQLNVIDSAFNTPVDLETYVNFSELFYKIKEDQQFYKKVSLFGFTVFDPRVYTFSYCFRSIWNTKEQMDNILSIVAEFPVEFFNKLFANEITFLNSIGQSGKNLILKNRVISRTYNVLKILPPVGIIDAVLIQTPCMIFNIVCSVLIGPMISICKIAGPTFAVAAGIMWSGFIVAFLDATLLHNELGMLFYTALGGCVDAIITLFTNPTFYESITSQNFIIPYLNPVLTNLVKTNLDIFTLFFVSSYLLKLTDKSLVKTIKKLSLYKQFATLSVMSLSVIGLGSLKLMKIATTWKNTKKYQDVKKQWFRKNISKNIADFNDKLYYCWFENPSYEFITDFKNSIQNGYLNLCKSIGLYQFLHDIELRNGEFTLLHKNIDSITEFFVIDNLARIQISKITNDINSFTHNSVLTGWDDYWSPPKTISEDEYNKTIKNIDELREKYTNSDGDNVMYKIKALNIEQEYLKNAYKNSKDKINIEIPRIPKMGTMTTFTANIFLDVQFWWRNPDNRENNKQIQKAFAHIFQDELNNNIDSKKLINKVKDIEKDIEKLQNINKNLIEKLRKEQKNKQDRDKILNQQIKTYKREQKVDPSAEEIEKWTTEITNDIDIGDPMLMLEDKRMGIELELIELKKSIEITKLSYTGLSVDYATQAMEQYINDDTSFTSQERKRMKENMSNSYKKFNVLDISNQSIIKFDRTMKEISIQTYEQRIKYNNEVLRTKGIDKDKLNNENTEFNKEKRRIELDIYKNNPDFYIKSLLSQETIYFIKDILPRLSKSIYIALNPNNTTISGKLLTFGNDMFNKGILIGKDLYNQGLVSSSRKFITNNPKDIITKSVDFIGANVIKYIDILPKPKSIAGAGTGLILSLSYMNPVFSATNLAMTMGGYMFGSYTSEFANLSNFIGLTVLSFPGVWWYRVPIIQTESTQQKVTRDVRNAPTNFVNTFINSLDKQTKATMLKNSLNKKILLDIKDSINEKISDIGDKQKYIDELHRLTEVIDSVQQIQETNINSFINTLTLRGDAYSTDINNNPSQNTEFAIKIMNDIKMEIGIQVDTLTDTQIDTLMALANMYAYDRPEIEMPNLLNPDFKVNIQVKPPPEDDPNKWCGIKKHVQSKIGVSLYGEINSSIFRTKTYDKLNAIIPKDVQDIWKDEIEKLSGYKDLVKVEKDSSTKILGENMAWLSYMSESSKKLKEHSVDMDMLLTMVRKTQFERTFDEKNDEILNIENKAAEKWTRSDKSCESLFGKCNDLGYNYKSKQYHEKQEISTLESYGIGSGDAIRLSDETWLKLINFERNDTFDTVKDFYNALDSDNKPEIKWNNPYLLDLFSSKRAGIDQTYYNELVNYQIEKYNVIDNEIIKNANDELLTIKDRFVNFLQTNTVNDEIIQKNTNVLSSLFENIEVINNLQRRKYDVNVNLYNNDRILQRTVDENNVNIGINVYAKTTVLAGAGAGGGMAVASGLSMLSSGILGAAAGGVASMYGFRKLCENLGNCPIEEAAVGTQKDLVIDPDAVFNEKIQIIFDEINRDVKTNSRLIIENMSRINKDRSLLAIDNIQKDFEKQYDIVYSTVKKRNTRNSLFQVFPKRVIDESYLLDEKPLFTTLMGGSDDFNSCILWENTNRIDKKYSEWIESIKNLGDKCRI